MYIFRYLKNTMGKMDIGGMAACGSWQVENTTPQITEGLLELEDINFADLFTPPTLAQPLPLVEQRPYENPRTIPNKEKKRIIKKKSVSIKKNIKHNLWIKRFLKTQKLCTMKYRNLETRSLSIQQNTFFVLNHKSRRVQKIYIPKIWFIGLNPLIS